MEFLITDDTNKDSIANILFDIFNFLFTFAVNVNKWNISETSVSSQYSSVHLLYTAVYYGYVNRSA